jgi:hypothetical protein
MLQTNTVEKSTLDLLIKLQSIPLLSHLRLVRGTALALQIGHRKSIDLDFFGTIEETGLEIAHEIRQYGIVTIEIMLDRKSIKMFTIENVKVDIVNYPYDWIESLIESEGVKMAGKKDIAPMKMAAITNRGCKKDFVDIYFLLKEFSLPELLKFYADKFPDASPYNAIRSLVYFEDAELQVMPEMIIPVTWEEVKTTLRAAVEKL